MKENILIVEDEFIVANDLKLMLTKAGYYVCGIAATVTNAKKMITLHQPTWVMLDIILKDNTMGIELARQLTRDNIGFIYISANTNQSILEQVKNTRPYGFLAKPFREKDLLMMLDIARTKHKEHLKLAAQREFILSKQLEQIAQPPGNRSTRIAQLPGAMQGFISFDLLKVAIGRPGEKPSETIFFLRTAFGEYQTLTSEDIWQEMGMPQSEIRKFRSSGPFGDMAWFLNGLEFRRSLLDDQAEAHLANHFKFHSKLNFSVRFEDRIALLSFYSLSPENYSVAHLDLLAKLTDHFEGVFTSGDRRNIAPVSKNEKPAVDASMAAENKPAVFENIIGRGPAMIKVLDEMAVVSTAPVSVLVLGESGTGKELVAKAIHQLSSRSKKTLVTVNCAALPSELIESELFGHEKGAFTGANERRAGKFEAADGGTIFLDEIGELSLEAQVKLLRVLQEQEFERVGSSRTIKIDVRVIAATNRNLEKEVAEGRMRLDFYYRLNVIPITLPSLRERAEDIPLLAQYFIKKYAKKLGRPPLVLNQQALDQLCAYTWPGNIRELEHLMERTLLRERSGEISHIAIPAAPNSRPAESLPPVVSRGLKTLEQMEYDHIVEVLKKCNGKINGPGGAAQILGLAPSTLNSKLKKMGVHKDFYHD
ncbi:MAG: sigma 54-interacting transcriptional regulator [Mucilaginibacter sp.]|nr:sigma 54-interacting transcriptional regulator [Mucilaginibacter sp.]